jgi:hypothetical protein
MIHYKNMGIAFIINVYFLFLCLGLSHLRYGAIDDYFMAGLLSGIYGNDYNVHLVFVNAIYGYVLLPLYHLFPQISWYYVGEIASIFISLTIIVYFIIGKVGRQWGMILGIILVAMYAKDFYVVLQFTQCAVVLTAAGMIALIQAFELACENDAKKKWCVAIAGVGAVLFWWGSFMRWDAFLMGLPFFLVALFFLLKKRKANKRFIVVVLLVAFAGAWGFHHFDRSLYQTPEYKRFTDFQPFRVLLGDGAFYDENAVYEEMQELGKSPKDFDLLKKWFFYDNEVFSPESVKVIENLIQKNTFKTSCLVFPIKLLQKLGKIACSPIFVAWLVFGIVLLVSNRQKSVILWASLVMFLLALSHLLSINRPVYRVQLGLIFYATVMVSVFWKRLPKIPLKLFSALFVMILTIGGWVYYDTRNEFRSPQDGGIVEMEKVVSGKGYEQLFEFMNSTPDSVLFVSPMYTYMEFAEHRLPPYLNEPMGSWQRIVPSGYWTPYYPDVETAFRKRGMKNPMKDVVNENVYFVSDVRRGTSLVDFLQEHHFDSVQVDTVKRFADVSVLKYSVVKE